MSYILDALKRADAERERGAVPGLHARQITTTAPRTVSRTQNRLGLILAAMLALGGIAGGLWLWRAPAADANLAAVEPAVTNPVVMSPAAQLLATPKAESASESAPPPLATAQTPAASPSPLLQPAGLPLAPRPLPPVLSAKAQAQPKAKPVSGTQAAKPGISASAALASVPVVNASSAPVAAPAIPLLADLPEDIRRQVPALSITGAVYSETPAQRLLLVNNQVLTQGSLVAPDLTLEEIRPRSSVFSFRGTRFRLAH